MVQTLMVQLSLVIQEMHDYIGSFNKPFVRFKYLFCAINVVIVHVSLFTSSSGPNLHSYARIQSKEIYWAFYNQQFCKIC